MTAHWGTSCLSAPTMTGSGDELRVAWVGDGQTLMHAWVAEFGPSTAPVGGGQTAVGRPSLTDAYIAWSGTDDGATINIARAADLVRFDQVKFVDQTILWGTHAPAGVASTFTNNRLYLAWADSALNLHLAWSSTPTEATSWQSVVLPESAIDAPSLSSEFNADVWLAWAGTDGAGTLNAARGFRPGSESTYVKTIFDGGSNLFMHGGHQSFVGPDTSPYGPQLEVSSIQFTLAYVGFNNHLYDLTAFAGQFNRTKYSDTSDAAVSVSGLLTAGGFAWRGLDPDHTLNIGDPAFMPHTDDNGAG